MSFDLTNKFISSTFQNLLQKTGSDSRLYDLEGNAVTTMTVGTLLPSKKFDTLGNPKQRWGKLYMASTIDVSGSSLTISSPSASAVGEDFGVSITGSLTVSGSNTFTVIGPMKMTGSLEQSGTLAASRLFLQEYNDYVVPGTTNLYEARFYSASDGSNDVYREFGNVGIGTDSPTEKLTVGGNILATGDIISKNFTVSSSQTYLTSLNASGSSNFGDSLDDLHTFTGSLIVSSSNLNVTSDKIGVGTSSPSTRMEVFGGDTFGSYYSHTNSKGLSITNNDSLLQIIGSGSISEGGPSATLLMRDANNFYGMYVDPEGKKLIFDYGEAIADNFSHTVGAVNTQNGVGIMTFLPSGNVGIGTTSPTKKFEVNGDAKFTNITATGDYNSTRDVKVRNILLTGRIYTPKITISGSIPSRSDNVTEKQIIDETGSLDVGLDIQSKHQLTGSVNISGSLLLNGDPVTPLWKQEAITANSLTSSAAVKSWNLIYSPNPDSEQVYWNGLRMAKGDNFDYTITGSLINFNSEFKFRPNDTVLFHYNYNQE
tara:strand:+ start:412 stop:2034 length:1623 start_codon:yes stop_codon:yes gene_type:complete